MAAKKTYPDSSAPPVVLQHPGQYGFFLKSEEEKRREDIFRPDMEKLQLFVRMLRRNAVLNKAMITHAK